MDISLWKRAITPRRDGGQGRPTAGTRLRCPAGCSILAQLLANQVEERPCPKICATCGKSARDRQQRESLAPPHQAALRPQSAARPHPRRRPSPDTRTSALAASSRARSRRPSEDATDSAPFIPAPPRQHPQPCRPAGLLRSAPFSRGSGVGVTRAAFRSSSSSKPATVIDDLAPVEIIREDVSVCTREKSVSWTPATSALEQVQLMAPKPWEGRFERTPSHGGSLSR